MRSTVLILSLFVVANAHARRDPDVGARMLDAARPLTGTPYDLGGRMQKGRGTDCQGVVFYAAERVQTCSWRSFSVMPTKTVANTELGRPVDGVYPVTRAKLDTTLLREGDVILFLGHTENPAEPALLTLDEKPAWVWHMGLYAGAGRALHASPFAGVVVEEDLQGFLAEHAGWVQGIAVLRVEGTPKPARCRRGARMPAPATARR